MRAGAERYAVFVRLADSMAKIRKRLGGALYQELDAILQDALHVQLTLGDTARHRDWISRLLQGYYDPMYRYQHSKVSERVVFSGDQSAVLDYLLQGNQ